MSIIKKVFCLQRRPSLALNMLCRNASFTVATLRTSLSKTKPQAWPNLRNYRNTTCHHWDSSVWKGGVQFSTERNPKPQLRGPPSTNLQSSKLAGAVKNNPFKKLDFFYDSEMADMTDEEATMILENLSEEEDKILRVRKLEFDVMDCSGEYVPKEMTNKMWFHALRNCDTESQRIKFYKKLAHREANKRKKEQKKVENETKMAEFQKFKEENPMSEELFFRRIHMTIRKETILRQQHNQLAFAMQYGPTVCFDFGFEHIMRKVDIVSLASQMMLSYGMNKQALDPLHFHFCNLKSDSFTYQRIKHAVKNIDTVPMTITEESYLDHYPKDKIIYLSPDGTEEMLQFEPDMVYIIGAIIDKVQIKPLTLAKAKREGIRHMRLPLDRFLRWKLGNKTLTMDQMTKILLGIYAKKDWPHILHQHIPQRKIN